MKNAPWLLALAGVALLVARLRVATRLPEAVERVTVDARDPALAEAFARVAEALEKPGARAAGSWQRARPPETSELAKDLRARGQALEARDLPGRLEVLRALLALGADAHPYAIELSLRVLETTLPAERRLSDDELACYREALKVLAASLEPQEYQRLTRQILAVQSAFGHQDDWNDLLPIRATEDDPSDVQ